MLWDEKNFLFHNTVDGARASATVLEKKCCPRQKNKFSNNSKPIFEINKPRQNDNALKKFKSKKFRLNFFRTIGGYL